LQQSISHFLQSISSFKKNNPSHFFLQTISSFKKNNPSHFFLQTISCFLKNNSSHIFYRASPVSKKTIHLTFFYRPSHVSKKNNRSTNQFAAIHLTFFTDLLWFLQNNNNPSHIFLQTFSCFIKKTIHLTFFYRPSLVSTKQQQSISHFFTDHLMFPKKQSVY
jgi:hypothetical protein